MKLERRIKKLQRGRKEAELQKSADFIGESSWIGDGGKGILPGTRSDDMTTFYDWPLEWKFKASLDDPFFTSLQNSESQARRTFSQMADCRSLGFQRPFSLSFKTDLPQFADRSRTSVTCNCCFNATNPP